MPDQRHPWTYRDKPESGGSLRPREQATPSHPTHRGRLYVLGHGWLWLSGWQQGDGSIRLAADPMSALHVDQYCAPRAQAPARQARLGDLMPAQAREQLAGTTQGTRAPASDAHARTPATPPGPRERGAGPIANSHTSLPLQVTDPSDNWREQPVQEIRRVDGGRKAGKGGQLSTEKSAEATAAAMVELNDEIPF